ncbi:hypothetical protein JMUB7504_27660 [Staphylococcus aureus]
MFVEGNENGPIRNSRLPKTESCCGSDWGSPSSKEGNCKAR